MKRTAIPRPLFALFYVALGAGTALGPSLFADQNPATDGVPRVIPYSGILELDGQPITAAVALRFTLYDGASGPVVYEQDVVVDVYSGRFTATLGPVDNDGTSIQAVIAGADDLRLGTTILNGPGAADDVALTGRQQLVATPYAMWAATSSNLVVAGNATVNGTLGVVGSGTIGGNLTAGSNATVAGTLAVQGQTTLNNATTVNAAVDLNGALDVSGRIFNAGGGLVLDDPTAINGNLDLNGTLDVSGSMFNTGGSLELDDDTNVRGMLNVSGDATFASLDAVSSLRIGSGSQFTRAVVGTSCPASANHEQTVVLSGFSRQPRVFVQPLEPDRNGCTSARVIEVTISEFVYQGYTGGSTAKCECIYYLAVST